MNISAVGQGLRETPSLSIESEQGTGLSFASHLDKSISEVNQLLVEADQKSVDLGVGKSENLHQAMISIEKADTAFKLMVQVRNKILEAYSDIMKMTV